jgi:hypothetical protein
MIITITKEKLPPQFLFLQFIPKHTFLQTYYTCTFCILIFSQFTSYQINLPYNKFVCMLIILRIYHILHCEYNILLSHSTIIGHL